MRGELQDVRDRRLGPKKMPISDITKGMLTLIVSSSFQKQQLTYFYAFTGAAALEIVDDFMKSPLMDKFGGDKPLASASQTAAKVSLS